MDEFIDDVVDTAERVGEFAEGLADVALGSVTHSARAFEADLDTDHDGSLLDNTLSKATGALGDIPVVGATLEGIASPIAEELGDFATDAMGTRHHGLFSVEGTLDITKTTDDDYKNPEGRFEGVGDYINKGFDGTNVNRNPADILLGLGAAEAATGNIAAPGHLALGAAAEVLQRQEDPFEKSHAPTKEAAKKVGRTK